MPCCRVCVCVWGGLPADSKCDSRSLQFWIPRRGRSPQRAEACHMAPLLLVLSHSPDGRQGTGFKHTHTHLTTVSTRSSLCSVTVSMLASSCSEFTCQPDEGATYQHSSAVVLSSPVPAHSLTSALIMNSQSQQADVTLVLLHSDTPCCTAFFGPWVLTTTWNGLLGMFSPPNRMVMTYLPGSGAV